MRFSLSHQDLKKEYFQSNLTLVADKGVKSMWLAPTATHTVCALSPLFRD